MCNLHMHVQFTHACVWDCWQPKKGEDDRKGNMILFVLDFLLKSLYEYFAVYLPGTSSAFWPCSLWVFVWFLWWSYWHHLLDRMPLLFFWSHQWTCWSYFFQNENSHSVWNAHLKIQEIHWQIFATCIFFFTILPVVTFAISCLSLSLVACL